MPSLGDAGVAPQAETPDRRAPTWPRFAVVAGVLVLAFVISRTSSQEVTQEEAVAKATEQVDFVPEDTQVRFLRQGIDRHPFWVVSLSIAGRRPPGPTPSSRSCGSTRSTGEIVEFREQKDARRGPDEAP